MQKKGANISLKGYDDIFSTDQSRAETQQERVQEIPLSDLHPFEGHPFRVVDDEEMLKTAESVREFGVLTPAIVRPDPDGGYEIISGHRQHRASELAGKETMPVIVRDMDDDAAIILMVDANLQRETILPSERAFAYSMKMDAMRRTAGRPSNISSYVIGLLLLVIAGCAIYCIVQAMWTSLAILVGMGLAAILAIFLLVWVVVKAESIGNSLGEFIRS